MSAENNQSNILSSWKEIAAYLKCGVRTCMRYEGKYGLPIRRLEEKPKTHVFAYKNDLDEWLKKRVAFRENNQFDNIYKPKWNKAYYLIFAAIVIGMSVLLLYSVLLKNEIPSNFRIEGSKLIIVDNSNNNLWEYDTGIENLKSDVQYQNHYQFKKDPIKKEDSMILPWIVIKDLNKDQKIEVLFSLQTQDEYNGGELICFNQKGKALWENSGGRKIRFGTETFADFTIRGIDVADIDDDGNLEIIVLSHAVHRFPTQISILNYEGKVLGEYWNSGHVGDYCFTDLNSDGKKEILVTGLNNEYKKGCLIVLDASNVNGGSPQEKDDYSCDELDIGSELYYILFPRTDVDYLIHDVESTAWIKILNNNHFSLLMNLSKLLFKLDFDMEIQNVILSNNFKDLHRDYSLEGKINSELNEEYKKKLANGLLYWDGQNWVSTPTMTSYWKNKALNH